MKKEKWVRPHTVVEGFVASEYIAKCNLIIRRDQELPASCVNPNHYQKWRDARHDGIPTSNEDVLKYHSGGTTGGRVNNVFTELSVNCGTIIPSTGIKCNKQHKPSNGDQVYILNANEIITYKSNTTEDRCFGAFQNNGGSSVTKVPLS